MVPGCRNAEALVGNGAGGSCTAGDIGGSGSENSAARSLSAAGTEFTDSASFCGADDPVGFCSDQRLMIESKKDKGLDKLRFNSGARTVRIGSPGKIGVPSGTA